MENENKVEEISSLIDDLLKEIKKLTNSTITIRGSFGTRVYSLIDRYNSNLNGLSSYMDNSFVPAYKCMKKYLENEKEIKNYTNNKESMIKQFEEKVLSDYTASGKTESEARSLVYEASRRYRADLENKIQNLRNDNNSLRKEIDLLSDERLQSGNFNEHYAASSDGSKFLMSYSKPSTKDKQTQIKQYEKYDSSSPDGMKLLKEYRPPVMDEEKQHKEYKVVSTSEGTKWLTDDDYQSMLYKKQKLYKTQYGDYKVSKHKIQKGHEPKAYKIQKKNNGLPYNVQNQYNSKQYKASGNFFKKR